MYFATGGRLPELSELPHGTRSTYQRLGCRCVPCKAAEACYRSSLRGRKARGLPLLGALVSAVEARRRIRQLKREGYSKRRIAHMAGWKNGHIQVGGRPLMRLRTLARVRRVAVFAMLEGADEPSSEMLG